MQGPSGASGRSAGRPRAVVLDADESLFALLTDVLGDLGFELGRPAEVPTPDLVLALVQRGEDVRQLVRRGRAGGRHVPVVLILPFADAQFARELAGTDAADCYTLGAPLDELRKLVLALSGARARAGAPGAPPSGGDDAG